jgi:hypothetical protein
LVENDLEFQAKQFIVTHQEAARVDDDCDDLPEACSDHITIPLIHLMYDTIRRRLGLFSLLAQTLPEYVNILAQSSSTSSMVCCFHELMNLK